MDEIVSILQNPEKMEQLILKLKTIGENSPQFQTFKSTIDSFHLSKPPIGVHETNILQHVFKYSDSRECFDSFRLVCKSWQNAVENIRLNTCPPVTIFQELCLHERNGHFPTFYSKYLKSFRQLNLRLDRNFDMTKWNSISNVLLQNMGNLSKCWMTIFDPIPPKFVGFLFNLFRNSKFTLTFLHVNHRSDIVTLPAISLPNLTNFAFYVYPNHENKVPTFDYLMKTVVDVMCPDLKIFRMFFVNESRQILKNITNNYPNHFVCGPQIYSLEHIPLKISYLKLANLAAYRYASHIEYLILYVKNLYTPSEGGWNNYKEILSFFPNLKGIIFYYKEEYTTLFHPLRILSSSFSQTIWQQRIDYFKSQNIKILSEHEYSEIISELRQSLSPSWSFRFAYF